MRKTVKRKMVLPILVGILGILTGVLVGTLLLEKRASEKKPIYQYVSLSEEAAAKAYIWLEQIEDMPLSYEQIKGFMGDIRLTVVLQPTQEKGKYIRSIDSVTAAECRSQAESGMEKAYREVIKHRFRAAGFEGEITDELLDTRMREAYGVSVSEYLESCDLQLLPAQEELIEMYSGEASYE